jgi:hypothetical protein
MRRTLGIALGFAVSALAAARGAAAQDEGALRAAFEGRTVTLRMDMPATSRGVEVYPLDATPVDYREVAERLKEYGVAIRTGQPMMVTKVVVKKNSHVEFQLGGGGYGTAGDWTGSDVTPVSVGETRAERALRDSIKAETDKNERKRMQRDLDALRTARERENARAAAEAQRANMTRRVVVQAKRLDAGSRFNIRYRNGIPPEGLTPDGVMRALAPYVDFSGASASGATASGATGSGASAPVAAGRGVAGLRKGLLVEQVDSLLGPAAAATQSREGALTLVKRTYQREGLQVVASFVSGVLIDFAITPR